MQNTKEMRWKNKKNLPEKPYFTRFARYMKISIYRPKKDRCEACLGHKLGHVSDTIFEHHVTTKEEAREAKDVEK